MHIDRLERLIEILENVPKTKFNLASWRSGCGTTACAVGWAMQDLHFQRLGLDYFTYSNVPIYNGFTNYEAAREFFGISDDEVYQLFSPEYYPARDLGNPEAVISRIKIVIRKEQARLRIAEREKPEKIEVRLETLPIEITRKPKKLVDMSDSD